MKRIVLSVLLVLALAACQVTLEGAVIPKGNGLAQAAAAETAQPQASDAPRWQEEFALADNARVVVDARIDQPEGAVPVLSLSPRVFTQQDADAVTAAALAGAQFYEGLLLTREEIAEDILSFQIMIAEDPDSSDLEYLQGLIKEKEAEYERIPENVALVPAQPIIGDMGQIVGWSDGYTGFDVVAQVADGSYYHYVLYNSAGGRSSLTIMPALSSDTIETYNQKDMASVKSLSIAKEDAVGQANEIAEGIAADLSLTAVNVGTYNLYDVNQPDLWGEERYLWRVVYMRAVNGFPSTYDRQEVDGDITVDVYDVAIPYEELVIYIGENGFAGLSWIAPMQETELVNENAAILPLDEVKKHVRNGLMNEMARFVKNVADKPSDLTGLEAIVRGLRLGLMRVRDRSAEGGYLMIPVWDVYLDWQYTYTESFIQEYGPQDREAMLAEYYAPIGEPLAIEDSYYSYLTINALTGAIIDRNLGY